MFCLMANRLRRMCRMLIIAAVILSMMPAVSVQVWADDGNITYYVDAVNGNDNNSGTSPNAAWKTLTKVNSTTFQPGDRILFKAGCTWNGQLWPKGSGTEGNPIVIDMYGTGSKPLFDGEVQGDNLVVNPGFESGSKTGWIASDGYSVINYNQYAGSYCVRVNSGNSAEQIIYGLLPNTTYTLKAWVKVDNAANKAYLGVKDFGGQETAVSTNSTGYKHLSVTFTTGAYNTSAKIYLWHNASASGYAYGDEFEMYSISNVREVFKLRNQSYWEVNNLQIVNWGADGISLNRRAVYVEAADAGTVRHVHFYNLDIHDVNGGDPNHEYLDYHSGGIVMLVVDDPGAPDVKTRFDDVLIEGCTFRNVSKEGIFIRNNYRLRGGFTAENTPDALGEWYPNTNVVIRNNSLDTIGGDGIVVCESESPLIEYNVAKDCHYDHEFWCVAIWSINCDNAVFQYNEAYGTKTTDDGQGFDIDWNQRGTIMQYNYSHDNEGGFMLMCCWYGDSFNENSIVRYNISQNDMCRVFEIHGPVKNSKIYNNTIYVRNGLNTKIYNMDWWDSTDGRYPENTYNYNNIYFNLGNGGYNFTNSINTVFEKNCFYGNHPSGEPYDPYKITSDPCLVNPGSGAIGRHTLDGYKLQPNSPCINAGKTIENNGGKDFWGNPVPNSNGLTDIGAHEYPGNDLCVGGTVTASSENPPYETAAKAFDDNVSTKWLSVNSTGWIQYDFPGTEAYAVSSYTITSANDVPGRDPKNWTLKGSNDGVNWTVVDTRSYESFDSRFQTKTFSFTNNTAYQMYRLEITANNGDAHLQLAEIEMFVDRGVVPVREDRCTGGAVYASSENIPHETAEKAFDDDIQTKWYAFGSTPWIQYDFDGTNAYAIDCYTITSANDEPGRDPKSWVLKGSSDAIYWTVLDTRTNEMFDSRGQTKTYYFNNDTAYTVYRLEITANNGANDTQIAEIEMFEN
ncbi:MAG TPA: hypothetical protein GXX36_13465 [Clostridiaceae bacterium]|nr:hypothetical protein [Clostridiaceae bacterium]